MKRAKLKTEEVTRIIVSATMTMDEEEALEALVIEHCCHTPEKLGCHYYIQKDGDVLTPVSHEERGNWFARYGSTAIFIVVEGGLDDDGQVSNNFMAGQLCWIKGTVKTLKKIYPNAELTLHRELFLGVNPVLTKEQIE